MEVRCPQELVPEMGLVSAISVHRQCGVSRCLEYVGRCAYHLGLVSGARFSGLKEQRVEATRVRIGEQPTFPILWVESQDWIIASPDTIVVSSRGNCVELVSTLGGLARSAVS